MSRRAVLGATASGVLAACVVLALAGCSASQTSTPSATPTHSIARTGASPTPTPAPTYAALAYTCDSLLPPATLAVFKSKASAGFTLQSDYLQRMQNIGSNLVLFSTYGGVLCQWEYPDASNSVDYAWSPITASQATQQQSTLVSNGYAGVPKDHGMLFANTDVADYPDEYLFIDGYWFQASSNSVMQLIVDNVFVSQ